MTTYVVHDSLPVAAGIGSFNASMSDHLNVSYLAFQFALASFNLVLNAMSSIQIDPPICYGTPCTTVFLNGGLAFSQPDPFRRTDLAPNADVIIVRQTRGLLASFWPLNLEESDNIDQSQANCAWSGIEDLAVQLCLAPMSLNKDHVAAGIYICISH